LCLCSTIRPARPFMGKRYSRCWASDSGCGGSACSRGARKPLGSGAGRRCGDPMAESWTPPGIAAIELRRAGCQTYPAGAKEARRYHRMVTQAASMTALGYNTASMGPHRADANLAALIESTEDLIWSVTSISGCLRTTGHFTTTSRGILAPNRRWGCGRRTCCRRSARYYGLPFTSVRCRKVPFGPSIR